MLDINYDQILIKILLRVKKKEPADLTGRPRRPTVSDYKLIRVGVFDMPPSPSLCVKMWAGRSYTLCVHCSPVLGRLSRRAG